MNIGLKCKRNSQSFCEKCSFCADDFWSAFKHGCKNKKITRYHGCFLSRQILLKLIFRKLGAYVSAKRQFLKPLSFRKWKNSFSQNFTTWKKNVLENLFRAIPSTLMILKYNFSHLRVREVSFFSCILPHVCNKPDEKIEGKCQSFCRIFLNLFNSFWTLGKNFLAGVSGLRSKCTLEHFEKSLCSTNETFFWKFVPISIKKKYRIFSHNFWNGCRNCLLRVQKIALRRKNFSMSFSNFHFRTSRKNDSELRTKIISGFGENGF